MRASRCGVFCLAAALLCLESGAASNSNGVPEQATQLPPGFAPLVPKGARLVAPGFSRNEGMGTVKFSAEKKAGDSSIIYQFELHCFADAMWMALEPAYRQQLEQEVDKVRRQCLAHVQHVSASGTGAEVYAPEVKSYPWGKSVTQRTDRHRVGEISGKVLPIITTYQCWYFGMANRSTFNMTVSGREESLDDANEWAVKAAEKAAATNLGNISE